MTKKLTQEGFIAKAEKKFGNKFDYSETKYTLSANTVTVRCRIHNHTFKIVAGEHVRKRGSGGCSICARESVTSNTDTFVEKATSLHKGKFSYDRTVYVDAKSKVTITCPLHGDFEQLPNDHLNGCGCRHCRTANVGWTDSKWTAQGETSKVFEGYKMYVVKIWDGEEVFYKIGKTFAGTKRRFVELTKFYSYKVCAVVEADGFTICKLERKYQEMNKEFRYLPKIRFCGHTECFTKVTVEGITYG